MGKRDEFEPIAAQILHQWDEPVQFHRFGDERIAADFIGGGHVGLAVRGREDDNRNAFEFRYGAHLAENFAAVDARQVEIEQNQIGLGVAFPLGETSASEKVVQRVGSVIDDSEVTSKRGVVKRTAGQFLIAGIIFHEEDHRPG